MEKRKTLTKKKKETVRGKDPRTFEENSQGEDPSTFGGRNHQAKRWRVQEQRKEEKWKKKKKEEQEEEEEGEAQEKKMVEKCKESIASLFALRPKEDVKGKERKKEARRPKVRQTLGKTGTCPSPFDSGAQLAMCQRCTRRTAEKEGGDGEDAAGTSGKRRQMGGGDSTKVEAAKRRTQD